MYTHVYNYVYTYVVRTCLNLCIHMSAYMYVRICLHICTHMSAYMYAHIFTYMYVCCSLFSSQCCYWELNFRKELSLNVWLNVFTYAHVKYLVSVAFCSIVTRVVVCAFLVCFPK